MESPYCLAAGGYRDTIALLSFSPPTGAGTAGHIKTIAESPTPRNTSWIERSVDKPNTLYSISEDPRGKVFSLKLVAEGEQVEMQVTAVRDINGAPAHLHCLKDGSGIAVVNYLGGSMHLFPFELDGSLSVRSKSPALTFPFPYRERLSPNPRRQNESHPHSVMEGRSGEFFVPDLGADTVWIVHRRGEDSLEIAGQLQAPPGSGPRHAVVSKDLQHLYLLTEMSHTIYVFPIGGSLSEFKATTPIQPLTDMAIDVVPPHIPPKYASVMDAAELCLNPNPAVASTTLYASNRYESRLSTVMAEHGLEADDCPRPHPDSICVVVFTTNIDIGSGGGGKSSPKLEKVIWVETSCDVARAMSVSRDGKFVAVAGQKGGGVEIYEVEGEHGEKLSLVAKAANLENIADLCWL